MTKYKMVKKMNAKKGQLVILNTFWTSLAIFIVLVFFLTILVLLRPSAEPEIISSLGLNYEDRFVINNFLQSERTLNNGETVNMMDIIGRANWRVIFSTGINEDAQILRQNIDDYFNGYYTSFVIYPSALSEYIDGESDYAILEMIYDDDYDEIPELENYKAYFKSEQVTLPCYRSRETQSGIEYEALDEVEAISCSPFNYKLFIPSITDDEGMFMEICLRKSNEPLPHCRPELLGD